MGKSAVRRSLTILLAALAASGTAGSAPLAARPIPYQRSSHATAAAMAVQSLGLAASRPPSALIADLEGQMYSCDCPAPIYYWDLAKGLRTWAALNEVKLSVSAGVVKSADPKERISFAEVQGALGAGAAVIATLAACPDSGKSAVAAYRCQSRVSALVTGVDAGAKRLTILLPDRLPEKERGYLLAARATLGKTPASAAVSSLAFTPKSGNLTFTVIQTAR